MNVKLLLDENLSPWVAETLRKDGLDAVHMRDRGLLEADDHAVLERAYRDGRVLVTCNVEDFVKLARARELHPGIVLVENGDLRRNEQLQVVHKAVAVLTGERCSGDPADDPEEEPLGDRAHDGADREYEMKDGDDHAGR